MKTRKNAKINASFLLIAFSMIFSLSMLSSCNKTTDTLDLTAEEALAQVQDETLASDLFDEVTEIGDEAINYSENTTKSTDATSFFHFFRISTCATITREVVDQSIVTTIDFGTENCEGPDGRLRRGIIIITRTGSYWSGEVNVSYTFDNYFVDDNQILGSRVFTGYINADENRESTIVTDGSIILADNAGTITWQANHTRTVTQGSDTWAKADDVIEITGYSSGTNVDGESFSSEILQPLVRDYSEDCYHYFVSGIVEITKADGTVIEINYGDGTCDNLIEVTINGVTEIVELGTCYNRSSDDDSSDDDSDA